MSTVVLFNPEVKVTKEYESFTNFGPNRKGVTYQTKLIDLAGMKSLYLISGRDFMANVSFPVSPRVINPAMLNLKPEVFSQMVAGANIMDFDQSERIQLPLISTPLTKIVLRISDFRLQTHAKNPSQPAHMPETIIEQKISLVSSNPFVEKAKLQFEKKGQDLSVWLLDGRNGKFIDQKLVLLVEIRVMNLRNNIIISSVGFKLEKY